MKVQFDPNIIPLEVLLDAFFVSHDPTSMDKQGFDTGEQYRSVIFYSEGQEERIRKKMESLNHDVYDNQILTELRSAETFRIAEEYHQDFYNQNKNKPYCQIIIDPKIKKVREGFKKRLKS